MKKLFLIALLFSLVGVHAQELKAFQFYNKKGKRVGTEKMVKDLANYDVVFIGEMHNNSINHWLELKLTEALAKTKKNNVQLGAEMFERDNQKGLDAYLQGKISSKSLKDSIRLWNNYATDYQPLVDFAKDNKLSFVATNVPRKYAAQVSKQGLQSLGSLPENEKVFIAKLPITVTLETPGYTEMKSMMGEHADDMKIMNFISAQAIKDATMAESIARSIKLGQLFIHYNGNYHSKEYGGIYWYLHKLNPQLKMAVISVFEADDDALALPKEKYVPTDYNLVLPKDMTKTY